VVAWAMVTGPGCFAATHPTRRVVVLQREDKTLQQWRDQSDRENRRRHGAHSTAEKVEKRGLRQTVANMNQSYSTPKAKTT